MGDGGCGQFATVAVVATAVEIGTEQDGVGTDPGGELTDICRESAAHHCIGDACGCRECVALRDA